MHNTANPFAICKDDPTDIAVERARRATIWSKLCRRYPDGRNVVAAALKELRIVRGIMGIYFDKAVAAALR